MLWIFFLLLAGIHTEEIVDGKSENACLESQVIEPEIPLNTSKVFSFPNTTDDVIFLQNKSCSWKVQIPENHFVILYINSSVPTSGFIEVTQTPNHMEKFDDSHVEVALMFVAPSFDINWFSGNSSKGGIHFTVTWQEYPANLTSKNYTLSKSGPSIVLDHEDTYNPVVFQAETNVSIICLPGQGPDELAFLRTVIVFDGPDWKSPFLGSLYSFSKNGGQIVTPKSVITMFSIVPIPSQHHVIVQEASIYQNMSSVVGLNIQGSEIETFEMSAENGSSVVVTQISNTMMDEYLVSVEFEDEESELRVYLEGLSDSQLISTYSTKNNKTHLPQKLQGVIRYYVLTCGSANISLTRDKWKANWETGFSGRRGFFTSKYWKKNPKDSEGGLQQDSFHFIGNETRNSTKFNFSYRVLEADISGENSLHIVVSDNVQRIHFFDYRSASEYTNDTQWYTHSGHSISLVYSSYNYQSTGFFAEFQIDSASGFSKFSVIFSLFIYLFYFF